MGSQPRAHRVVTTRSHLPRVPLSHSFLVPYRASGPHQLPSPTHYDSHHLCPDSDPSLTAASSPGRLGTVPCLLPPGAQCHTHHLCSPVRHGCSALAGGCTGHWRHGGMGAQRLPGAARDTGDTGEQGRLCPAHRAPCPVETTEHESSWRNRARQSVRMGTCRQPQRGPLTKASRRHLS